LKLFPRLGPDNSCKNEGWANTGPKVFTRFGLFFTPVPVPEYEL